MGGLKRLPTAPTEVQDGRGEHPRILFPSLQSSPYFFFDPEDHTSKRTE